MVAINILAGIGAVTIFFVVVLAIQDHFFIKNMNLEQAKSIALERESGRKTTNTLKAYVKARKILLDNGYWKYDNNLDNALNMLGSRDYIKDLITGRPLEDAILKPKPSAPRRPTPRIVTEGSTKAQDRRKQDER